MEDKKRIAWVDCAKGIAIILVIVGHTISSMPLIRGPIFSFHMPLFFILSGYTTVCARDTRALVRRLKKTFFGLFVLANMLFLLRTALKVMTGKATFTLQQILAACFWANGIESIQNGIVVPSIYVSWFLVALFWVRNLYDALHFLTKCRCMSVLSVAISVLGAAIGQWMYLPFGLDMAMASFVFYDFGQRLKSCRLQPTASRYLGLSAIWGGVPAGRVCIQTYLL